jgi:hypothetical protein
MSKNFIMLAQNSKHNYVKQACVCAMSIHKHIQGAKIAIITNDLVPSKYEQLFSEIISIPWEDLAIYHDWKVHNRWKILHVLPYDNAIVLDTDMLILEDISHWFDYLSKYDLFYTTTVKTYRNEIVTSDYYRKTFTKHDLPNLYSGVHYITQSSFSYEFNNVVDKIIQNWKEFAGHVQKTVSIDVAASLAAKILNCETKITNANIEVPSFTHMKPNIQNWKGTHESWQTQVGSYFTNDLNLWVGNYKQAGIFHYTEKTFLTEDIVKKYETNLGL